MNTPLISVIVPTYNRAQFLDRCLRSILSQTERDLELILVDDHSTDNTESIVSGWIRREPRLRFLSNQHAKGISGARNTGLDAARGRFISFLDTDDLWLEAHLADSMVCFRSFPQIDCYSANRVNVTADGSAVLNLLDSLGFPASIPGKPLESGLLEITADPVDLVLDENFIDIHTFVIRAESLGDIRFNEQLAVTNDREFIADLALTRRHRWAIRNRIAAKVLRHDESITADNSANIVRRLRASVDFYDRILRDTRLTEEQSSTARAARRHRLIDLSFQLRRHRQAAKSIPLLLGRLTQFGAYTACVELGKSLLCL